MSTYLDLRVHIVFATKGRQPWIAEGWRHDLHAYLGGVVRGLNAVPLAIGGVEDHVHLLVGLRGTHAVAELVREVKKASTAWIRSEHKVLAFAWQEGYAALSVGSDRHAPVIAYIARQEIHHRKQSSRDELRALLHEAGVPIDERFFE